MHIGHMPIRSRGGSGHNHGHGGLEDFHFIEGVSPAQFLNQQLTTGEINSINMEAPQGLVKPMADLSFLSAGSKLRKSLSRKLKRHLAGSYSKYDGDRSSTSYPRDKEQGSRCGSQRRIRPKKSVTPVKELMNSTKLLTNPITEESHSSAAQSPSISRPNKIKATRNESFGSSISSTVRIDSAVQKGRERLKMSRRSSASASQRNSIANSEHSSANDLRINEKDGEEEEVDPDEVKNSEKDETGKGESNASETRSTSHSISTLQTNNKYNEDFDQSLRSCSGATTMRSLETPLAISLDELLDPEFKIKGPSAISLRQKSSSPSERSSNGSQRSLSVCSELNSRILFQRGGKNRASGRSNKITEVPLPPSHPPPLPPRKISSQPCMPKPLKVMVKTNDDYADIDDIMFDDQVPMIHRQDYEQIYTNEPPRFTRNDGNIDYVQICPIATTALKELSSSRGTSFKRSNSLYDILALQSKSSSKKQQQQQSSEAEYYASFDWTPALIPVMGPRAFTSSTSNLTHLLSQARNNLQKGGSANASANNLRNIK